MINESLCSHTHRDRTIYILTYHICLILKLVSEIDVADKIATPLARISPRHGGTYGAHLRVPDTR